MELIKSWVWNPNKNAFFKGQKSEKAQVNQLYCSNKENCTIFKEGNCKLLNGKGFGFEGCEYGKRSSYEGYTSRARNFYGWISDQEKYNCGENLKKIGKGIYEIGDFYYLNFDFIDMFKFKNEFKFNMIKKQEFNLELILDLIKFKPRTLFGDDEIKDYQKKEVPLFIENLKLKFKDLFNALPKEIKEKYTISNLGRKALIHTLNKNIKFDIKENKYFWDGEKLICKNYNILFQQFKGENEVVIYPNKDETIEVKNEDWVNENTKYID